MPRYRLRVWPSDESAPRDVTWRAKHPSSVFDVIEPAGPGTRATFWADDRAVAYLVRDHDLAWQIDCLFGTSQQTTAHGFVSRGGRVLH